MYNIRMFNVSSFKSKKKKWFKTATVSYTCVVTFALVFGELPTALTVLWF